MDNYNEALLDINPSVMSNKQTDQSTSTIDSKYGVELFTDSDMTYAIYDTNDQKKALYADQSQYTINIDQDLLATLYTKPDEYPISIDTSNTIVNGFFMFIIAIQVIVVTYFIIRVLKLKRG